MARFLMPQEIEVWYLLPAIRRELAKSMIENLDLSQKKAAELLGVTEACISQYVKAKRADDLKLDKGLGKQLKDAAKQILKDPDSLIFHVQRLCKLLKSKGILCRLHREKSYVPDKCRVCRK